MDGIVFNPKPQISSSNEPQFGSLGVMPSVSHEPMKPIFSPLANNVPMKDDVVEEKDEETTDKIEEVQKEGKELEEALGGEDVEVASDVEALGGEEVSEKEVEAPTEVAIPEMEATN